MSFAGTFADQAWLFEAVPDGVVGVDKQGAIQYVNRMAAWLFGYEPAEMLGKPVELLVPERLREAHVGHRAAFLSLPQPRPMGVAIRAVGCRKDGSEFPLDISLTPVWTDEGMLVLTFVRDVTEKVLADKKLQSQADLLESILSNMADGVAVADVTGRLVLLNAVAERVLGKGLVTVGPREWQREYDLFRADGVTPFPGEEMPLARALMGEAQDDVEMVVKRPGADAETRITVSGRPLRGLEGRIQGGVVVFRDITQQREAQLRLEKSEASLSEAQRVAHLGNWDWDIVGNRLSWSDEIYRIFGLTPQSFGATYQAFLATVHHADRRYVERSVEEALAGRSGYSIDHRIVLPSGEQRVVHEQAEVQRSPSGTPQRMIGTVQDVTERWKAEERLRRAVRAMRVLSHANQALVRAPDESALLHAVCTAIVEQGGYRLAWVGLAEQGGDKRVIPVAQAGFEDGYLSSLDITWGEGPQGQGPTGGAVRTGRVQVARDLLEEPAFRPWRAEALRRGYASSVALPLIVGGVPAGALNIYAQDPGAFDEEELGLLEELASDLAFGMGALRTRAERAQAEARAVALQAHVSKSFEASPAAMVVATLRCGKIVEANGASLELLGAPRERVMGSAVTDVGLWGSPAEWDAVVAELEAGRTVAPREMRVRRSDGRRVDVMASFVRLDIEGTPSALAIFLDISQRKAWDRMREELLDVISHELRTPVTIIAGYAELIAGGKAEPSSEQRAAMLARVQDAVRHLTFLLASITEFTQLRAEKAVVRSEPIPTGVFLNGTLEAFHWRRPKDTHTVTLEVDPMVRELCVDPRKLTLGLLELLDNAAKFSEAQAPVTIAVRREGPRVRLAVSDRGPGLPPEVRDRLGQPFALADASRTRSSHGIGLGLALAGEVARVHGGTLEAAPREGGGSSLSIVIPM